MRRRGGARRRRHWRLAGSNSRAVLLAGCARRLAHLRCREHLNKKRKKRRCDVPTCCGVPPPRCAMQCVWCEAPTSSVWRGGWNAQSKAERLRAQTEPSQHTCVLCNTTDCCWREEPAPVENQIIKKSKNRRRPVANGTQQWTSVRGMSWRRKKNWRLETFCWLEKNRRATEETTGLLL